MDVVCLVVELLDPELWVVLRHFIGFVLEVEAETSLDDFSSVLGTDDDMIVAEVDGVGIVYIVHASILSRGAEEAASASIPRAYARGFTCAIKKGTCLPALGGTPFLFNLIPPFRLQEYLSTALSSRLYAE